MEEFEGLELLITQNAQLQGIRAELRALRLTLKADRCAAEDEALENAERDADEVNDIFTADPLECAVVSGLA